MRGRGGGGGGGVTADVGAQFKSSLFIQCLLELISLPLPPSPPPPPPPSPPLPAPPRPKVKVMPQLSLKLGNSPKKPKLPLLRPKDGPRECGSGWLQSEAIAPNFNIHVYYSDNINHFS